MSRLSRAERLYGRLLKLYPPAYRQRFGAEMRQNFRDLHREHSRSDDSSFLFWGRTFGDLTTGVVTQYGELIRSQSRSLQFLLAAAIVLAAFGSYQFFLLQNAHSSFNNYASFRGCDHITSQSGSAGTCILANGQTIKMVRFHGQWYLDGDLPWCWRNICL